mmetsp:Transcript_10760/g.14469  ORF Transcript_10760/g.14469 Transcript_10760/m.14469 type:complete len:260 (+) Transcript_10760:2132-2911(+)
MVVVVLNGRLSEEEAVSWGANLLRRRVTLDGLGCSVHASGDLLAFRLGFRGLSGVLRCSLVLGRCLDGGALCLSGLSGGSVGSGSWLFTISCGYCRFILKTSFVLLIDDIKLDNLADREEYGTAMRERGSGALRSNNVQALHSLLLIKMTLDSLELAQVSLGHQHRLEILLMVPELVFNLLAVDGLESVVAHLSVELRVRLKTATNELNARGGVLGSTLGSNTVHIRCIFELKWEASAFVINTVGANLELTRADTFHPR